MSDIALLSTVIGIVGGILAAIFGYSSYKRNQRLDSENDGRESGTIMTEIGYIKAGIDEIRRKQDILDERCARLDERYTGLVERVASVEASTKQAHKRIDRLEKNP